ncbi:MAG: hypothetical protein AAFN30_15790, partial [Actinomycetota bacterium]
LASSRAGHFFTMIVTLVVPATLINGLASFYAFRGLVITSDAEAETFSVSNDQASASNYALAAVTYLMLLVAGIILTLAATRQAWAQSNDEAEPWSDSVRAAFGRLGRAVGNLLVVGAVLFGLYLVLVISVAVSPALLLITFPVWLVAVFWFGARFCLVSTAATLAPRGTGCLRTSWDLTATRVRSLIGRMAVLTLFSVSLWLLMRIVAAPFVAIAGAPEPVDLDAGADELRVGELLGDNPATFAIGQLFGALGNGTALVLWAVGLALVYRDLRGPVEPAA